jgi:hypothetical protein
VWSRQGLRKRDLGACGGGYFLNYEINTYQYIFCDNSLANAVGALYVRRNFKEEARAAALEMVTDIRTSFLEILKEIEWMDGTTRSVHRLYLA